MPSGALFDLPTVIITIILTQVFFSAMMLLYGRRQETYPGFTIWAIQLVVLAVGQVFVLLRGSIPDIISIFGSNFCNILGILLTYEAASRICTGRPIDRRWYLLIPVMIAGLLYWYLVTDSFAYRMMIFSGCIILLTVRISLVFLRNPNQKEKVYSWLLSADYIVLSILLGIRAVDYLAFPAGRRVLEGTIPNNLLFFYYLFSSIGATFIFITLHYDRLADELNESHQEIQQLATRYDLATTAAGARVWEYDLSSGKADLNDQISLIFNLKNSSERNDASLSADDTKSIFPEDLNLIRQRISGILHENEEIGFEYRIRMHNGETRYHFCNARSFLTPDGRSLRLIGLNTDITPLRTTQNALSEAMKKLSLLASITRHDIINCVSVIGIGTELLMDEITDPNARKTISRIEKSGEEIYNLIRFTSEYQEMGLFEPVWVDITNILSQTWVRDLIGDRVLILPPPGTVIFVDQMIEKVLYNLLENSIRHGGEVSTLTVSYELHAGDLMIIYTDDGKGIDPDEKNMIFNLGYGKNTGMGLFLCREILAITGLSIYETGQSGSGVRFEIVAEAGLFRKKGI